MNILVAGGAGFIGSHLVARLINDGHCVRIIDNLSTGKIDNLCGLLEHVEFIHGDLRHESVVREAVSGIEIVFHQAALPSVPRSVKDPKTSVENNVLGTVELLKQAVDAGVRRFIYAGSSSAYGNCNAELKAESIRPSVLSPYAASKLAGESLLQAFHHCYGLETVVTRYFNVFGERQDASSQYSGVIAKFIRQMIRGEVPTINGDGTHSRDFTYVANVVEGNILAATGQAQSVSGEVFNVACGGNITLCTLVEELNEILERQIEPNFGPPRAGDIQHSRADITKARKLLGYEPMIRFGDGLRKTVHWYCSRESAPSQLGSVG